MSQPSCSLAHSRYSIVIHRKLIWFSAFALSLLGFESFAVLSQCLSTDLNQSCRCVCLHPPSPHLLPPCGTQVQQLMSVPGQCEQINQTGERAKLVMAVSPFLPDFSALHYFRRGVGHKSSRKKNTFHPSLLAACLKWVARQEGGKGSWWFLCHFTPEEGEASWITRCLRF